MSVPRWQIVAEARKECRAAELARLRGWIAELRARADSDKQMIGMWWSGNAYDSSANYLESELKRLDAER